MSRSTSNAWFCVRALSCITVLAVIAWGCAAGGGNQGDFPGGKTAANANLSPEQCLANGQIVQAANGNPSDSGGYIIRPGDQLELDFYLNPEFNDQVSVRPDGKVTLRVVGDQKAAGLTPQQLALNLDKAYESELRSPGVSVHVRNSPFRQVFVQGEVSKPGAFPLESGMTALQAITEAGGLTADAGSSAVLIRRDACGVPRGQKFNVATAMDDPSKGEDVALMPRDIVVVPRSGIANLDLWVRHYIRDLLPVTPYLPIPL